MAVAERTKSGKPDTQDLRRWRDNAADWAEDCVWIQKPDGSIGPIELYPEQRQGLEAASRRKPSPDGTGVPLHKTVVYCRPKRNNKSLDAAILAAHSVALFPRRDSYIVANSADQARSVTFDYVGDIFRFSPMLQGMAFYGSMPLDGRLGDLPAATEIRVPELGSRVKAVPSNWKTVQGITVSGVLVVEELHAAQNESIYAMLSGQTEAIHSQIIIASQAGGRNGVLYKLYQSAGNRGGSNARVWFDYWDDNKAPWITAEWLADRQEQLPPWEFDYLHRNQWGTTGQRFLSPELVDQMFAIDYTLLVSRHDPAKRKARCGPLVSGGRAAWMELRRKLELGPAAFGIGLDRAKPYAGREGTNVAAHAKALMSKEPGRRIHYWEIASVDCPDGSDEEIEEGIDAIQDAVGQRIPKLYEEYQAADLAIEHGAEMVSATTQRQVRMFNRVHRLVREGRYHCSPASLGLAAELEEFYVDTERALPRFEHSAGNTDDRIYSHAYSLEAAAEAPLVERRFGRKPEGF